VHLVPGCPARLVLMFKLLHCLTCYEQINDWLIEYYKSKESPICSSVVRLCYGLGYISCQLTSFGDDDARENSTTIIVKADYYWSAYTTSEVITRRHLYLAHSVCNSRQRRPCAQCFTWAWMLHIPSMYTRNKQENWTFSMVASLQHRPNYDARVRMHALHGKQI